MEPNTNFRQNSARIYTGSAGGELYISTSSSKQTISASNNRSQYYAEQAKEYRDEAKTYRDNAKLYAEQNSDVTAEAVNNMRAELLRKIDTKQDSGDYALKSEIPVNISELNNDSLYATTTELNSLLPLQENYSGRFLATNGETLSWQGLNSFTLFDTKISDRVLSYEEALGWALQGTYVYKEALAGSYYGYPDFYNKCLEEYTEATSLETVNSVTIKVHSNGHKFYDIADKTAIDNYFSSIGSAWFYGIDTENERIFLPRNSYFEQVTSNQAEVGKSIQAGLPNIHGYIDRILFGQHNLNVQNGAFKYTSEGSGANDGGGYARPYGTVSFDASRSSSVYGRSNTVQPNSVKKLLYICVGNTINYECMTEIVNQGMDILNQVAEKVNVDGTNLNVDGKSLISSFGMSSNKYVDLTPGASGTRYTAPANGWIKCWGYKHTTNDCYVQLYAGGLGSYGYVPKDWGSGNLSLPIRKGQGFSVEGYNNTSEARLQFYYAQGEV